MESIALDNEMDVGESESSNNSNSPEPLSDDESVDDGKIKEIQEQIKANPYVYETHVHLITLLRKAGDLDALREAREEMNELFPLTPELWLDWLTDEQKIAVTDTEKDSVTSLFERAVKDYYSVAVWLEYVQYVIGLLSSDSDSIERVRNTFEKALAVVGIHVVQGSLIWDAYREFEQALLIPLKELPGESEDQAEKIKQQEKRIYILFRRQLSVPLMYMDKTYKEFREFKKGDKDSSIHNIYQKAFGKLETIKSYEDTLFHSEPPHLEEYKAYIQHELEKGDPVRVQSIYERALVENCLVPEMWSEYTKYLDRIIRIEEVVLAAHERAVRNCPWSLTCWKNYAMALERYKKPHDTIKDIYERAFNAGFTAGEEYRELWLGYLDYMRRRCDNDKSSETSLKELNTVFERANEHIMTYYKESDPQCSILQYWAKSQAKYCNDISKARELWNEIMNQGHHGVAEMWINFANFERTFGDEKHYRKVLLKGLHSASDWPESLGNLLLTFEREEGSLESLETALEKYDVQIQRIQEKRQRIAEKEAKFEESKKQSKKERKEDKKGSFEKWSSLHKTKEVKSEAKSGNKDSDGFKIPQVPFHQDPNRGTPSNKRPSEDSLDTDSKRRKMEEPSEQVTSYKNDPLKDDRTVFISNLAYTVEEDTIKSIFSKVGDIEEVRLVKDFKGRSKGFCYVVFTSRASVKEALTKDRERLEGRPVFVSRCKDKTLATSSEQKFKFNTGLEKNKLFIKNLPFETTEEDLNNLYKEFGSLKEVRLVTYRNGHSKGLAYVEYEDEASAKTALVKTDGLNLKDHVISVAISNPPQRKQRGESSSSSISSSLGGGSSIYGSRGRGRTQVTLLPRSVQRPRQQSTASAAKHIQNGNASESNEPKKLGNEDFRNMLLKK